ncbi:MAG: MBL fold metallo-hydrolase [Candidatus Riflebacteria bacterium]|nr:MBL fold metallo-hydrolase [Candidatus Riflebacteria bacterium]
MKLTFLGGAAEVGASCTLIELGNRRILVDCGIRMSGDSDASRLPDLSQLNDAKPDAVILTHAHMDHSGALPLLLASMPKVPLYLTPPTGRLLHVLFADALKIMNDRREAEIPLYSVEMVEHTLNMAITVPFEQSVALFGGEIRLTFRPAGHILGASLVSMESDHGNVLFTGDFSVDAQKTVDGTSIPHGHYDLVVTESTYGARFHAPRRDEEDRLANMVYERVSAGGFVLVPAFALGRAQEIILTLSHAMEKGRIPHFPVYVDGMVTTVCHVYRDYPNDVTPALEKRIKKLSHPFFPIEGTIKPVLSPKDREQVLRGPPAAIIASSGMLTGGPSVFYATELASKSGNLIAITGYQDEESPGRKLLELSQPSPEERNLVIGRKTVTLRCVVSSFGLSAHADGQQVARFIGAVAPQHVALVHGDAGAREDLWSLLRTVAPGVNVHLPDNGGHLNIDIKGRKRSKQATSAVSRGIGDGRPPESADDMASIHAFVLKHFGHERFLTARELFGLFCGPEFFDPEAFDRFRGQLRASPLFSAKKGRSFLFKAVSISEGSVSERTSGGPWLEQNAAIKTCRALFSSKDRLLKVGVRHDTTPPTMILSFAFPDVAKELCLEKIEALASQTGYAIQLDSEIRQNELMDIFLRLLPAGVHMTRNPAFYREEKTLGVRIAEASEGKRILEIADTFFAETGVRLKVELVSPPPLAAAALAKSVVSGERLEINGAFALIQQAFVGNPGVLLKKSRKTGPDGDYLELGFVTPQAAEPFQAIIETLRAQTGWRIQIAQGVNQAVLSRIAVELTRFHGRVQGNPSLRSDQRILELKLDSLAEGADTAELDRVFHEKTGFNLRLVVGKS